MYQLLIFQNPHSRINSLIYLSLLFLSKIFLQYSSMTSNPQPKKNSTYTFNDLEKILKTPKKRKPSEDSIANENPHSHDIVLKSPFFVKHDFSKGPCQCIYHRIKRRQEERYIQKHQPDNYLKNLYELYRKKLAESVRRSKQHRKPTITFPIVSVNRKSAQTVENSPEKDPKNYRLPKLDSHNQYYENMLKKRQIQANDCSKVHSILSYFKKQSNKDPSYHKDIKIFILNYTQPVVNKFTFDWLMEIDLEKEGTLSTLQKICSIMNLKQDEYKTAIKFINGIKQIKKDMEENSKLERIKKVQIKTQVEIKIQSDKTMPEEKKNKNSEIINIRISKTQTQNQFNQDSRRPTILKKQSIFQQISKKSPEKSPEKSPKVRTPQKKKHERSPSRSPQRSPQKSQVLFFSLGSKKDEVQQNIKKPSKKSVTHYKESFLAKKSTEFIESEKNVKQQKQTKQQKQKSQKSKSKQKQKDENNDKVQRKTGMRKTIIMNMIEKIVDSKKLKKRDTSKIKDRQLPEVVIDRKKSIQENPIQKKRMSAKPKPKKQSIYDKINYKPYVNREQFNTLKENLLFKGFTNTQKKDSIFKLVKKQKLLNEKTFNQFLSDFDPLLQPSLKLEVKENVKQLKQAQLLTSLMKEVNQYISAAENYPKFDESLYQQQNKKIKKTPRLPNIFLDYQADEDDLQQPQNKQDQVAKQFRQMFSVVAAEAQNSDYIYLEQGQLGEIKQIPIDFSSYPTRIQTKQQSSEASSVSEPSNVCIDEQKHKLLLRYMKRVHPSMFKQMMNFSDEVSTFS